MFSGLGIFLVVFSVLLAVAALVLVGLLARALLAATRTLDTVNEERRLRIDLLVADRGDDVAS